MNICIGAKGERAIKFETNQTPTPVTYGIMENASPLVSYRQYWVEQGNSEHVKKLDKWLETVRKLGLEVEVWLQ